MGRIATFGTGTKLLLGAGGLLLVGLFLTWQAVPVKFGPKATVTQSLDGWDAWGLLIALLTLSVVALAVAREHDDDLAFDPRVARTVLVLGCLVLAATVVKSFRDSDSTWASYLGIVLAALVAVGAYLDFAHEREPSATALDDWRPRDRSQERPSAQQSSRGPSSAEQAPPRW
jgi:peptidoglycan/LPS O-acetylase OafA/YrhL